MERNIVMDMAHAMIAARDLCGNEGEAAREAALYYHHRKPTDAEFIAAIQEATRLWRESQRGAGVPERYMR